jgi:hypothetical protein
VRGASASIREESGWGYKGTRTLELLIELASRGDGEGADKLLKVDCAIAVFVKDVEDVFCKLTWIAKWEELLVDAPEFLLVELATWTVPEEALVPV